MQRTDTAEPSNFTVKYVCFAGFTFIRKVTEGWWLANRYDSRCSSAGVRQVPLRPGEAASMPPRPVGGLLHLDCRNDCLAAALWTEEDATTRTGRSSRRIRTPLLLRHADTDSGEEPNRARSIAPASESCTVGRSPKAYWYILGSRTPSRPARTKYRDSVPRRHRSGAGAALLRCPEG